MEPTVDHMLALKLVPGASTLYDLWFNSEFTYKSILHDSAGGVVANQYFGGPLVKGDLDREPVETIGQIAMV